MCQRGATVVIIGRNPERTAEVAATLQREHPRARVHHELADFSSLDEVRALAARLLAAHPAIHLLINNAGVWHPSPRPSRDGHDDTFAVNHLAHFALSNMLLERMQQSAPARVVTVSSRLHAIVREVRLGQLPRAPRIDLFGFRAYGESKLANILFSNELARRLAGSGVTSNAIHPGDVATNVARDLWLTRVGINIVRPLLLTPEQGARTTLHVACSPSLAGVTGRYFVDATEVAPSRAARDEAAARALWQLSADLTGVG